jgi:WD40 repeat protein
MALSRVGKEASSGGVAWPLAGGGAVVKQETSDSALQLVVTGHMDGTVKFWDSTTGFDLVYTLSPPPISACKGGAIVHHVEFCTASRRLCVAHEGGAVLIYKVCGPCHCSIRVILCDP